ncbi:MAG: 50S ribosomal protein L21 [Candidatus Gracilibacteria bacterium]|jgi:large subunit ribosomal protein L21
MFAVVYLGGKQYRVREKDELEVEKVDAEEGKNFKINEVLLMAEEDGSSMKIGTPFVAGAHVECQVLEQGKGEKIYIATYQSKKRTHRRQGHRQLFSTIKVLKISAVEKKVSAVKEEAEVKEAPAEKVVAKKPAAKKAPAKKAAK